MELKNYSVKARISRQKTLHNILKFSKKYHCYCISKDGEDTYEFYFYASRGGYAKYFLRDIIGLEDVLDVEFVLGKSESALDKV